MVGSQSVRVLVVELGLGLAAGPLTAASKRPPRPRRLATPIARRVRVTPSC